MQGPYIKFDFICKENISVDINTAEIKHKKITNNAWNRVGIFYSALTIVSF